MTTETTQETQNLSIIPSIKESERFIQFLNNKFTLNLSNDLLVLIHETPKNTRGYFRSVKCDKIWKSVFKHQQTAEEITEEIPLNSIVVSSNELKTNPYETIAHELAHYLNFKNNIKDVSGNQYHNKHFQTQAEQLFLSVERDKNKGYAFTKETEQFKAMLEDEFKPNVQAFAIFQELTKPKTKKPSRMIKYVCGCGCIIRTARNHQKPLKAVCQYCNSDFEEVLNE